MDESRPEAGFTLIEVLVAAVVMVVGLFGVMAIFPQAFESSEKAGRTSVLNHLAAEKMEQLRALDYDDPQLSLGTHPRRTVDGAGEAYYPVPGFPTDFSLRYVVSSGPTDETGANEIGMKSILIEATYAVRYDARARPLKRQSSVSVAASTLFVE